ncbi:MAG TPA: lysophospholipid acyltransferase family protein [Limnobacter sp.]|uniref:lysophospholipid acyltransferase family protein n=2 Tax=Limnobacter sp. TaxID=2003368 RepID=UPI002E380A7B|nr:lysophospholipid acyltransferase family protein [Limnobacter sp.]HEX5487426.1 lysophospholipid acyltransferase family protein [Limnobacter sp.]
MRVLLMKLRLLAHLLYGLWIAAVLWPLLADARREAIEKKWARKLLHILNVEVDVEFEVPEADFSKDGPMLLFSNHVSWLDIFAINAHYPVTFIAKSEIASWPVIGLFARRSGALFIERGKRTAVRDVIEAAVGVLKTGRCVAVFPEGTTGYGETPLPFHSNFVQPAIQADVPVLPVSLQYFLPDGRFTPEPAFVGEQTMVENLKVLFNSQTGYRVKLYFHKPVVPAHGVSRRDLSDAVRKEIAARCEQRARKAAA